MAEKKTSIVIVAKDQASKPIAGVGDSVDKLGKKAKTAGTSFMSFSNILLGGAFIGGLKKLVGMFGEQERATKQTEAVLRSTGQVAGVTAKEVQGLADEFQNVTSVQDEAVQSAVNMLLTFTKIGKETLPLATEAVLDMATAMNGGATPSAEQLSQTAIRLGKAMNDPIAGVTALRRVGVQLTDSQKAQIEVFMKSGDIMSAQKIILQELATEFGGSARKQAESFTGQMEQASNVIGDVGEQIGGDLVPGLGVFATLLSDSAKWIGETSKGLVNLPMLIGSVTVAIQLLGLAFGKALFGIPTIIGAVVFAVTGLVSVLAKANRQISTLNDQEVDIETKKAEGQIETISRQLENIPKGTLRFEVLEKDIEKLRARIVKLKKQKEDLAKPAPNAGGFGGGGEIANEKKVAKTKEEIAKETSAKIWADYQLFVDKKKLINELSVQEEINSLGRLAKNTKLVEEDRIKALQKAKELKEKLADDEKQQKINDAKEVSDNILSTFEENEAKIRAEKDTTLEEDLARLTAILEAEGLLEEARRSLLLESESIKGQIRDRDNTKETEIRDKAKTFLEEGTQALLASQEDQGASLLDFVKRQVNAQIDAWMATEIAKAQIQAPLSFGSTLLAIAPIVGAGTAGKALINSIKFHDGGTITKDNTLPYSGGNSDERVAIVKTGEKVLTTQQQRTNGSSQTIQVNMILDKKVLGSVIKTIQLDQKRGVL